MPWFARKAMTYLGVRYQSGDEVSHVESWRNLRTRDAHVVFREVPRPPPVPERRDSSPTDAEVPRTASAPVVVPRPKTIQRKVTSKQTVKKKKAKRNGNGKKKVAVKS